MAMSLLRPFLFLSNLTAVGKMKERKGLLPLCCLVVAVVVACLWIPAEGDMIDPNKVVLVDYTNPSSGMTNFLFRFVIVFQYRLKSHPFLVIILAATNPILPIKLQVSLKHHQQYNRTLNCRGYRICLRFVAPVHESGSRQGKSSHARRFLYYR